MSQPLLSVIAEEMPLDAVDIVRDILRDAESLPRLMEIHYLMQEPGLVELMRGLGALPEADRRRLTAYLARHCPGQQRVRPLPRRADPRSRGRNPARRERVGGRAGTGCAAHQPIGCACGVT